MADNDGSYVYVVDRDGQVERRPVSVGSVIPDGVVIAHGLSGRERVVSVDGGFLHSGEKVTVASTGAPQT
jgi:hypothetical protein